MRQNTARNSIKTNTRAILFVLMSVAGFSSLCSAAEETAAAPASEAVTNQEPATPTAPLINPPQVAIRMLGSEFNIQVLYDYPMDQANNDYLESIQMETTKGEFLGLSQFGPNAKEAYAEFMINPKLAQFTEVILVAKSSKGAEVRTPVKLELTEAAEIQRKSDPKSESKQVTQESKDSKNNPAKEDKQGKKKRKLGIF